MSTHCCPQEPSQTENYKDVKYRRILWIALSINLVMFLIEVIAGFTAGSVSLQADALDFLSDAINYGISIFVVGMILRYRSIAALIKGLSMGFFGVWVLGAAIWHGLNGTLPDAMTIGAIGFLALLANVICAVLLWTYRSGDSNMKSVWLCSRNDAIGNVIVICAALGVFGTNTGWPDIIVATIMAFLALQAAKQIIQASLNELKLNRNLHL